MFRQAEMFCSMTQKAQSEWLGDRQQVAKDFRRKENRTVPREPSGFLYGKE